MTDRFFTGELPNGLRIVVERMEGVKSAAAGFLSKTGARDENPELAGVSHFLEHMCFKGTAKRDAAQINIDFDRLGGHPNAFTSQDRTFYHGVTRASDLDAQIEILADMMRSTLPPGEFDMEKNVVLEEIAQGADRIEHVAFDLILETVFAGHSLGWPVLGYERTIKPLTRDAMFDYFTKRYAASNLTLVVAGNADPKQVVESAARYCGHWERGEKLEARTAPTIGEGKAGKKVERFNQQVVAINFVAPPATDELHETAEAIATILGGSNSRFFWNIEQTGLSPHAAAYRLDYADCGLLILLARCDPDNTDKLIEGLRTEACRLMKDGATEAEIQRVKNKRRTSLAVEGESPYRRLVQVMDDADYRGEPQSVEKRLAAVDAVGAESIAEYFHRYPVDVQGVELTVGPRA